LIEELGREVVREREPAAGVALEELAALRGLAMQRLRVQPVCRRKQR